MNEGKLGAGSSRFATAAGWWIMRAKDARIGLRPLPTSPPLCPQPHRRNSIKKKVFHRRIKRVDG